MDRSQPTGAPPRYDTIGQSYARFRQPDPHLEAQILDALGDAGRVLNVGAGTGSYEPTDRAVVAVEPSAVMIGQRPSAAPTLRATAEALPFPDDSFDAVLALLTVHHWSDWRAGLAECRRVAPNRQVVLSWEPEVGHRYWFVEEYLPTVADVDAGLPTAKRIAAELPGAATLVVSVPAECTDGFFAAYWRRPEAYLDPEVRASISTFAMPYLEPGVVDDALARLDHDLRSGAWHERHAELLSLEELDVGYRLIVA